MFAGFFAIFLGITENIIEELRILRIFLGITEEGILPKTQFDLKSNT